MSKHELDDDVLLTQLRGALDVPRPEPSPAESAAFHRVVADTSPGRRLTIAATLSWFRRPLPAVALAATCTLTGVAAATLWRVPITDPVRAIAHDVGLPLETVELVQARRSMSDLRGALQTGDDARIARAADDLREHLAGLDAHDREPIAADASRLLHDADQQMRHDDGSEAGEPDDHGGGVSPTAPAPTTSPTATTTSSEPHDERQPDPEDTTPTSSGEHHETGDDSDMRDDTSHTGSDD